MNERLKSLLNQRREWAKAKGEAERMLKTIDPEIIVEIIQMGEEKVEHDGYTFKVTDGNNEYIGGDSCRETLLALELNPDEINWFMGQVTKTTPYTYVDMRKAKVNKDKDGGEGHGS